MPSDAELRRALRWIATHGTLVDFDCPESEVRPLYDAMTARRFLRRIPKTSRFDITAEAAAFLKESPRE